MGRIGDLAARAVRVSGVESLIQQLAAGCEPSGAVLDLGCGGRSPLRSYKLGLRLIGVDTDPVAIESARAAGTHDRYIRADLTKDQSAIRDAVADENVQLAVLLHVIEHMPRRSGFDLMELAESVTTRWVVVETPNRFLPQGPEYGSEAQRHLSGWFPHDFISLGYQVRGTAGTRHLRGYAGQPRFPWRGGHSLDLLLARLLWIERFPANAFSIAAWKDTRGVEARLGSPAHGKAQVDGSAAVGFSVSGVNSA